MKIGTEIVTEPAFLVTRQLEDHVGWVDNSSIKKKILEFNGKFDDYDIMNWFFINILLPLLYFSFQLISTRYLIRSKVKVKNLYTI